MLPVWVFTLRRNRQPALTTTIKGPPFAVIFPPSPHLFLSTPIPPSARPLSAPVAPIGPQQIPCEAFFSNLSRYPTWHCLASSLSFHPYADLGCPAFHLLAMAAVEASAPASASVWRPTRFSFSCTHAVTPLHGRSLPSRARCSLILCQRQLRRKGEAPTCRSANPGACGRATRSRLLRTRRWHLLCTALFLFSANKCIELTPLSQL